MYLLAPAGLEEDLSFAWAATLCAIYQVLKTPKERMAPMAIWNGLRVGTNITRFSMNLLELREMPSASFINTHHIYHTRFTSSACVTCVSSTTRQLHQLHPTKKGAQNQIVEETRTTWGVASSEDMKFRFCAENRVMCNNIFIPGPFKGCQMDGSWDATQHRLSVQQKCLESAGRFISQFLGVAKNNFQSCPWRPLHRAWHGAKR